jgi:hypothetical protein
MQMIWEKQEQCAIIGWFCYTYLSQDRQRTSTHAYAEKTRHSGGTQPPCHRAGVALAPLSLLTLPLIDIIPADAQVMSSENNGCTTGLKTIWLLCKAQHAVNLS